MSYFCTYVFYQQLKQYVNVIFIVTRFCRVCILISQLSFLSSRQKEKSKWFVYVLEACSRRGIPDNGRSSGVDGGQRPFSDDID